MNVRVCVFDGDCQYRLEPVDGADGMLSQRVCGRKIVGRPCKFSKRVSIDKLASCKGINGYCGGYLADSLLFMGRSGLVDFLPVIRPCEYDILFSWARDFARRGIPFYIVRRAYGVALFKRSSC
jgi:hypothetical protein